MTQKTPTLQKTATRPATPYRLRGLDGIRALAALAVLGYHLLPTAFPGGFTGVDVFFVLSGFLITALLAKELRASGRIDLRRFWLRRWRRLFPAVATTVLVTVPLAALVERDLLVGAFRQVASTLTFTYNWVQIYAGTSYFDQANPQLLRHMWTLAIEQQFYLLWPLILLLIWRLPERHRFWVPIALAGVSVVAMWGLGLAGASLDRIYQGLDTHSFGLTLGAALALLFPRALEDGPLLPDRATISLRAIAAWLGLAGILVATVLVSSGVSFTYPWGVAAVSLLTLGVIQACFAEVAGNTVAPQALKLFLQNPVLVWLGERSYSLYLWHWPLSLIVKSVIPRASVGIFALVTAVLSIGAAALSYRFVESPMRREGIIATVRRWLAPLPGMRIAAGQAGLPLTALKCLARPAVIVAATAPLVIAVCTAPQLTSAEMLVAQGQAALSHSHGPKMPAVVPSAGPNGTKKDSNKNGKPAGASEKENVKNSAEANNKQPKPAPKTPAPPVQIDPNQVAIVGDSVTLAAAAQLQNTLPGAYIDAKVSRSHPDGIQIVRTWKNTGHLRPYLVYSLATNSTLRPSDADRLLAELPAQTKLVVVTGFGPAADYWIGISNTSLRQLAAAHPERVQVAEWEGAIGPHLNLLAGDKTHPGPQGAQIYANLVRDALNELVKKQR